MAPLPPGPVWKKVWPPGLGAVASRWGGVRLGFAARDFVEYLLGVHSLGSGGASLGFP